MPDLQKLSLKCSSWIMSRVSVSWREIVLTDIKVLKFWAEDVYKVFGIPCSHRKIKGTDANNDLAVVAVDLSQLSEDTLSAIKVASLGNSDDLVVGEQVVAIGNGRLEFLEEFVGPRMIQLYKAIKLAFDDRLILNPGKVVEFNK